MFTTAEDITARKFIGKYARIRTAQNNTFDGYIYVVDPESKTVVLTHQNNFSLIMANSIESIEIDEQEDIGEKELFPTVESQVDEEELRRRKERLKEWLTRNFLEVIDDGKTLKCQEDFIIEPPYNLENCYCKNTVVLERLLALIEKCPKDL